MGKFTRAPNRPLIRTREVCKRLDICRTTLGRLVRLGRIRPIRLGPRCVRYEPAAVEALIDGSKSGGRADA